MKRIALALCVLVLSAAPAAAQFGGAPSQSTRGTRNVFGGTNYSNGVSTRPNVFGGQDFYKGGSRIGSSKPNVFGGQSYSMESRASRTSLVVNPIPTEPARAPTSSVVRITTKAERESDHHRRLPRGLRTAHTDAKTN